MYRINELMQINKNVFSTSELATLWRITKDNTLWVTIKRYVDKGILYRIHKGLYSKIPLEKVDKYELGCALMGTSSYISLETILEKQGIIMQKVNKITLVGEKNKKVTVNNIDYTCKQMKTELLLNRTGIKEYATYSIATLSRAIADIQYYKPNYYFDNELSINWEEINKLKKEVDY